MVEPGRRLEGMRLIIKALVLDPAEADNVPDDYSFVDFWRDSHIVRDDDGYQQFMISKEDGEEVARLELDLEVERSAFIDSTYPMEAEGKPLLEIQFIDVREKHRRSGIGALAVQHLEQEYPDHQLIALADDRSEKFWEALGWTLVRPEDTLRPDLYIAPVVATGAEAVSE